MAKAGGDLTDDAHVELFPGERRLNIDPRRIRRQPQQVGVVMPRTQGRGEQHGAACSGQTRADKPGRHHIAQAQARQTALATLTTLSAFDNVKDEMRVKQLGNPHKLDRFEIKALQRTVDCMRMIVEVVANGRDTQVQAVQKFARGAGVRLIVGQLLFMQGVPFAVQTLQRFLQHLGRAVANGVHSLLIEAGAVHLPRTFDHVVRLVDQYRNPPLVELAQAKQQGAEVEVIVVVGNHHVRPTRQFLAQVVRTDLMLERHLTHARLIEPRIEHCCAASRGQAVVKTLGQQAGIAIAGFVRVLAGLVARHQFQHAQG